MRCLVIACLAFWSCSDRGAPDRKPDRRAELERSLRETAGDELGVAATKYRELMGEHPDALRKIATAYGLRGEPAAQLDVLHTLISRGQDTTDDRLTALVLAGKLGRVDDAMYQTGLGWLEEAVAREPSCPTFAQLVAWTEGRPEHARSLDQALAGCPRDFERAGWYASRAAQPVGAGADDTCRAVVHGEFSLARACVDSGAPGWRQLVAKALLGDDPPGNLKAAVTEPEVTAFVLLQLAKTPGVPAADRCAALARARSIELGWLPKAGHESSVHGRYDALLRAQSCP